MNWSGLTDPNTDFRLHAFVLGAALLNLVFGFPFLSIPLFAWVAARWIVMGFGALKRHAEERALAEWNGRYFAYDDKQVRVHWDDSATWIEAEDIFRIIGRKPDPTTRERIRLRIGSERFCVPEAVGRECFSGDGVLDYLAAFEEDEPRKLRRWLEREVFANLASLRERGTEHFKRYRIDGRE